MLRMKLPSIITIITLILLIIGAIVMLLPYWFMVVLSFETLEDSAAIPPKIIPVHPIIANFLRLFDKLNFERNYINSLFITLVFVGGQLILSLMAGYGFARFYFPLKQVLFAFFLAVFLLPGVVLLIPRYLIANELGLVNTFAGVVFFDLLSCFGIFLYRQHFLSIPTDFEEAAIVDGASIWQIFWHIGIPLSKGLTISFGVLVFIFGWNYFLWSLIILSSTEKFPLSVALALLQGQYYGQWPTMAAGAAVATVLPIIIFVVLQRRINLAAVFTGLK